MYGGGFSTVPAYLRDMFGTRYVGAIHGLLLTAWSMAGIFGPVLVNYIREYNVAHGVPKAQAYNVTMYIMAGLLVIGFICNLFVKAVDKRYPHAGRSRSTPHWRSGSRRRSGRPAHKERAPWQIQISKRHHDFAARAGLGLRRHPADARA